MDIKKLVPALFLVGTLVMSVGIVSGFCKPDVTAVEVKDAPPQSLSRFSYVQLQMAMPMRITVWAESESHAQSACRLAFARASELVKVFSDYDESSETRRLLNAKIGEAQSVSEHLMTVIKFSEELCRKSEGAFNPTAGSVIRLWRTARKTSQMPNASDLAKQLKKIGFDNFGIETEANTITLLSDEAGLDFGAVAKGYIGDQVIAELRKNGIEISYYEAGGDIVLGDAPPRSSGWQIDVGNDAQGTAKTLPLKNCAVSTSGDSMQFVDIEGTRYSHVVDPRTGVGVASGKTAFVIAPNGMHSDALATVGCILSENDFLSLLKQYEKTTGWLKEERWTEEPSDLSREQ